MNIKLVISVLLMALFVAGCTSASQQPQVQVVQPPAGSAAGAAAPLPQPVSPEVANQASGLAQVANGEYPTSPEGVVQAFLATYDQDPLQLGNYLSTSAQSNIQANAVELLQFNGMVEGFVIDQAAVNPDLPGAFVGVAIQAGGVETRRDFLLGKENDQWKIESISIPEG